MLKIVREAAGQQREVRHRRAKAISSKERDAIVAALRANPDNITGIAADFGRGTSTIAKLRQKAQVTHRRRKDQLPRRLGSLASR